MRLRSQEMTRLIAGTLLHALEVRDALAKLLPLTQGSTFQKLFNRFAAKCYNMLQPFQHVRPCDHVAHGIVKGTLCQTNHLGTNPNATFVQQLDSNLVALAHLQGSSPNLPFTNDSDTLDQLQLTMVNTMKNDE